MGTFCDQSIEKSSKCLRIKKGVTESYTLGTHSTPATPASEDTPTEEVGGLICPIGRKVSKGKAKVVV